MDGLRARSWALRPLGVLLALIGVLGLGFGTNVAQALLVPVGKFGAPGSAAGQLSSPNGVAVDQSSGDVYVADSANHRVDKFDAAGKPLAVWGWGVSDGASHSEVCTSTCQIGLAGSGAGQLSNPTSVAVDSSLGASAGDVYVGDASNKVVEKFDSSGDYISTIDGSATPLGSFSTLSGVAVDQSGDLWAINGNDIDRFDDLGAYVPGSQWNDGYGSTEGIAVDSTTNAVYLIRGSNEVERWTLSGGVATLVDPNFTTAVAVDPASGSLYAADRTQGVNTLHVYASTNEQVDSFALKTISSPSGLGFDSAAGDLYVADAAKDEVTIFGPPIPGPPAVESESYSTVGATHVTVSAHVIPFGNDTTCKFEYVDDTTFKASGYASAASTPCNPSDLGSSFAEQSATATLTGLAPSTIYHFRVAATNSAGTTYGSDMTFTTTSLPSIDSQFVINVTDTEATLTASINPNGGDTTYQFQFGTDESYSGGAMPAIPIDIGSGTADRPASVDLRELQPNTIYHFRVVADGVLYGADETFRTYAGLSPSPTLPDGRAYELVTPAAKNGGSVLHIFGIMIGDQASAEGEQMAYSMLASPPGSQTAGAFYIASRNAATGWSSQSLIPPQAPSSSLSLPRYDGYSEDLSRGVLQDGGGGFTSQDEPPLVSGEPQGVENLFLRDVAASSYQLVDVTPNGVTPGNASFAGASPDYSHIIFKDSAQLTETATTGESLYEWFDGRVYLVNQLEGKALSAASLAVSNSAIRAVSTDGSHVFFTAEDSKAQSHLYVNQDVATAAVTAVDLPQGGAGTGGGGRFLTASTDGSRVIFSDGAGNGLTADTVAGSGENLYEYNLVTKQLKDLTAGFANVAMEGVLGSSRDASYVYFVAGGVLASGATSGESNLYLYHAGTIEFIATLSASDSSDWGEGATARVTPDGVHLAFNSINSLKTTHYENGVLKESGYDNTDATSSNRDKEVYLYDAGSKRLVCASCNPTGAKPIGDSSIRWAESSSYQQRNLSADGTRLFFDSNDVLAPQDINHQQDVYEYEPAGAGECSSASFTFSEASGGCVSLISSGTASEESAFFDASSKGDDVFFITRQRLVPQDVDDSIDIYDARVGGGFPAPAPLVQCGGEECKPPPSPSLIAPAPATVGPGDPVEEAAQPLPTGRASARLGVLAKALHAGRLALKVRVPGRGRVSVSGSGIRSVTWSIRRAGAHTLTVALAASEMRKLRHGRRLTLTIRLRFVPALGSPSVTLLTFKAGA